MNSFRKILIASSLVAFAGNCFGADTLGKKYPAYVLIQLRSEKNRIEALAKAHWPERLEEVKKDAREVIRYMVADFKANFHYCPVYYYIDTNLAKVKKKQFEGILLDDSLNPVANIPIRKTDHNYVIVYYGYPVMRDHHDGTANDSNYINVTGQPGGRGLIINDDRMMQISYITKADFGTIFLDKETKRKRYVSKHFDIEYLPVAKQLDMRLKGK